MSKKYALHLNSGACLTLVYDEVHEVSLPDAVFKTATPCICGTLVIGANSGKQVVIRTTSIESIVEF